MDGWDHCYCFTPAVWLQLAIAQAALWSGASSGQECPDWAVDCMSPVPQALGQGRGGCAAAGRAGSAASDVQSVGKRMPSETHCSSSWDWSLDLSQLEVSGQVGEQLDWGDT